MSDFNFKQPVDDLVYPPIQEVDFDDTVPSQFLDFEDSQFQDVRGDKSDLARDSAPLKVVEETNPRLYRVIKLMWGTKEMQTIFNKWLVTDTHRPDGSLRTGFPVELQSALLELSNIHSRLFGTRGDMMFDAPPDRW